MHISKTKFYIITFCFLVMPFSVNWKLLLFGTKSIGRVIDKGFYIDREGNYYLTGEYQSVVRFYVDSAVYFDFVTPENIVYPVDKEIIVFYNKNEPKDFLMFNFAGILLSEKLIIPIVIFILWIAFYLTIKQQNSSVKKVYHLHLPGKNLKHK